MYPQVAVHSTAPPCQVPQVQRPRRGGSALDYQSATWRREAARATQVQTRAGGISICEKRHSALYATPPLRVLKPGAVSHTLTASAVPDSGRSARSCVPSESDSNLNDRSTQLDDPFAVADRCCLLWDVVRGQLVAKARSPSHSVVLQVRSGRVSRYYSHHISIQRSA
jgi:hypothetical protein